MLKTVLIIGGYGKVGGSIAQQLYRKTSLKIYVGGRSYEKANTFCEEYCPQAHMGKEEAIFIEGTVAR
ncbi:NAD(P)-binding domain-containing protein [Cytobacillus spongiae]|uniref:NAD(P)-binding domain-containing protein n=1 Tax=Cytobacillus spongiae TaxID=2901381 RepID=UPI001F19BE92|nr:NAD(P)-binding domain-containing protein [Cytobacillus spongiae]UII56581.1 NAD(P)-binding domain-containing protein [Cytobacillus spongiae]